MRLLNHTDRHYGCKVPNCPKSYDTLQRLNGHLVKREGQYWDKVNKKEPLPDDLIQHHKSHLKSQENKDQAGHVREKGEEEDQVEKEEKVDCPVPGCKSDFALGKDGGKSSIKRPFQR